VYGIRKKIDPLSTDDVTRRKVLLKIGKGFVNTGQADGENLVCGVPVGCLL
jgi:hypothetical protein